ncbi:MAG: hypothetical protein JWP75_1979 [Frondihabitans sp.]|nr:hypothetical protein [Frondihabitans sp.]
MTPIPVRVRPEKARELLSEGVRRRILTAILDGTLTPGERLHDEELIAWLGVSRTPIRTALERLAEAGLVEMEPNRFTRVALPSPADLSDALEVYRSLQAALVGEVVPSLTDADLGALEAAVARAGAMAQASGASGGAPAADDDLLAFFAGRSGNAVLLAAVAEVELRLEFFFRSVEVEQVRPGEEVSGDLDRVTIEILRGSRGGDPDRVASALTTFVAARAAGASRG